MAVDDMSAGHIAAQSGFFEPQRQNNALLRIFGLGEGEDILAISIESFPLPKTTITASEAMYMNETVKFAGRVTFEDLSVVYKDFVDMPTLKILSDWYLTTYNPWNGRIGLARNYKKTAEAVMYGPQGGFERKFKLQGLWINSFDPGDQDMTGEGTKLINIGLSIDKAFPAEGLTDNPSKGPNSIDNDSPRGQTAGLAGSRAPSLGKS